MTNKGLLGEGGAGQVFPGKLNIHTNVAVKKIHDNLPGEKLINIIHEVEIMNKVRHPKLINFYGYLNEEKNRSLLIDLAEGGDLSKYLHNRNDLIFSINYLLILN